MGCVPGLMKWIVAGCLLWAGCTDGALTEARRKHAEYMREEGLVRPHKPGPVDCTEMAGQWPMDPFPTGPPTTEARQAEDYDPPGDDGDGKEGTESEGLRGDAQRDVEDAGGDRPDDGRSDSER